MHSCNQSSDGFFQMKHAVVVLLTSFLVYNGFVPNQQGVGSSVGETVVGDVKHEPVGTVDGSAIADETIDLVSDYATTCSSSSDDDEAVVLPKVPNRLLLIPDDVDIWKHSETLLRTDQCTWLPKGTLGCSHVAGKSTDRFRKEGIDHRFDVIKCTPCFKTIAPENR